MKFSIKTKTITMIVLFATVITAVSIIVCGRVMSRNTNEQYTKSATNISATVAHVFVNRRYEIALKAGQDEKTTSLEFKDDFDHDKVKVKMSFRIEISEASGAEDDKVERNYSYTTDLWHRVERLNSIVTTYVNSEFVREMGKSYIRPPVMRTNAILKNKNLRQCLTLWQFIETYESAGYSMLLQENLESVDEEYLRELYSTLALQYMIFRYNIRNEFEIDSTLDSELTEDELRPKIIDKLNKATSDEFDTEEAPPERMAKAPDEARHEALTPEDKIMLQSLDVAMDAAAIIRGNGEEFIYSGGDIKEPEENTYKIREDENAGTGEATEENEEEF